MYAHKACAIALAIYPLLLYTSAELLGALTAGLVSRAYTSEALRNLDELAWRHKRRQSRMPEKHEVAAVPTDLAGDEGLSY